MSNQKKIKENQIKISKGLNSNENNSSSIHQTFENDQDEDEDEEIGLEDLDLDHIHSLRTQSVKNFQSTLQSIYSRYEGDGDEEADDVVDLVNLEVIEDRGQIIKTLGSRLDNLRHQRDSNLVWTKVSKRHSNHDFQADSDATYSDEEGDWVDDETLSVSSSDSVIFPPQPSSPIPSPLTATKITLRSELPKLLSPSKLSTLQSFQHINGTATNALFERLKQRVQEKSLDLWQLRNTKKARETSQESEASSRVCTKIVSHHPPTLASDTVTDSSSEPWKDSSTTYRTAPSESSSRHSLCSSPITPRYSRSLQTTLEPPLLPISALRFSSTKRSRPVFDSCLTTSSPITSPRPPRPGPSRLKNELKLNPINQRESNGSTSSATRPVVPLPRPHKRSTTWIDPKPIPVNQASRESSEDPLCLPPTPSRRRRSEVKSKANPPKLNLRPPKPELELDPNLKSKDFLMMRG
ncbi:hypothetical protein DFH28DRAFT_1081067 [Melampsora americana]|nr:hypothetical protein DFH28DRAFT_1081067 [Melampsora americana]